MDEQNQKLNRQNHFESDSHKLLNKHMADPNHQITDEELANVRVGMSPGPDVPTQQAINESEDRIADEKKIEDEKLVPGAQKITPWDTLQP